MADYELDKSFIAAATTTQFQVVKFGSADNTCTPVTATSDEMLGVAQESCAAADAGKRVISVRLLGVSEVIYGGSVTRGARLKVTATGTVIAATTDADFVVGRALTSGVSGDRGQMLLTPAAQRGTA
jgi:hypothetical protein